MDPSQDFSPQPDIIDLLSQAHAYAREEYPDVPAVSFALSYEEPSYAQGDRELEPILVNAASVTRSMGGQYIVTVNKDTPARAGFDVGSRLASLMVLGDALGFEPGTTVGLPVSTARLASGASFGWVSDLRPIHGLIDSQESYSMWHTTWGAYMEYLSMNNPDFGHDDEIINYLVCESLNEAAWGYYSTLSMSYLGHMLFKCINIAHSEILGSPIVIKTLDASHHGHRDVEDMWYNGGFEPYAATLSVEDVDSVDFTVHINPYLPRDVRVMTTIKAIAYAATVAVTGEGMLCDTITLSVTAKPHAREEITSVDDLIVTDALGRTFEDNRHFTSLVNEMVGYCICIGELTGFDEELKGEVMREYHSPLDIVLSAGQSYTQSVQESAHRVVASSTLVYGVNQEDLDISAVMPDSFGVISPDDEDDGDDPVAILYVKDSRIAMDFRDDIFGAEGLGLAVLMSRVYMRYMGGLLQSDGTVDQDDQDSEVRVYASQLLDGRWELSMWHQSAEACPNYTWNDLSAYTQSSHIMRSVFDSSEVSGISDEELSKLLGA